MSIHDNDYSELLTDLALVGYRNREPRLLFFKSFKPKACKPKKADALVALLSKALDAKIAGKISGRQFKRLREKVNRAIRDTT